MYSEKERLLGNSSLHRLFHARFHWLQRVKLSMLCYSVPAAHSVAVHCSSVGMISSCWLIICTKPDKSNSIGA